MIATELQQETWRQYRAKVGVAFWPLMFILAAWTVFVLLSGWHYVIALLPWLLFFGGAVLVAQRVRQEFWRTFARAHGWTYAEQGTIDDERAAMFKEGHGRQVRNVVSGMIDQQPLRIFEYLFKVGHGKRETTYTYTVYEIRFHGSFPHVYLNHRRNQYSLHIGTRLPLPVEFEKSFHLFGPKEYEIEVLEIFTPDILELLLSLNFPHDVELVNQELLVFTDNHVGSFTELDLEFGQVQRVLRALQQKLNRLSLTPIGNLPYHLT